MLSVSQPTGCSSICRSSSVNPKSGSHIFIWDSSLARKFTVYLTLACQHWNSLFLAAEFVFFLGQACSPVEHDSEGRVLCGVLHKVREMRYWLVFYSHSTTSTSAHIQNTCKHRASAQETYLNRCIVPIHNFWDLFVPSVPLPVGCGFGNGILDKV